MANNFNTGIGAAVLGGIAAIGYAIYNTSKLSKTSEKLDLTLDEVSRKTNIDVEQSIVDKAIERAVDRRVAAATNDAVKRIREDIHSSIESTVKKEVEAQYKLVSDEVSEKISSQVAAIDEYAFKEKVMRKAEDKIIKKFDGSLDGLLGDFNRKLSSVSKIYENIEDTLGGRRKGNSGNGRSVTFNLDD